MHRFEPRITAGSGYWFYLGERVPQSLLSEPQLSLGLQLHVKVRRTAGKAAKPKCHVGRNAGIASQNSMQRLPRDLHPAGRLGHREPDVIVKDLAKQLAGMRRHASDRSVNRQVDLFVVHYEASSMILLQINP
jgi:hypothetical protein